MKKSIFEKYRQKLKDYQYIDSTKAHLLKKGGYVYYIDQNHNLKFGGILLNFIYEGRYVPEVNPNCQLMKLKLVLRNEIGVYQLGFMKYYLFFRKHRSSNDKLRELFLSTIDSSQGD